MTTAILVHGHMDSAKGMARMAAALSANGRKMLTPSLTPSNGSIPLEALALQLKLFIDAHIAKDEPVHLIGVSMGGLVCRYYLQRLGGLAKATCFISISTPHYGTYMAYLMSLPAVKQMRPGSAFLLDLNKDVQQLGQIPCHVLYTRLDTTIVPASSSVLPVGSTDRFWVPAHFLILRSKAIRQKTEALLLAADSAAGRL